MKDLRKQGNITVDPQKQKREALAKEHKEKITAILTPAQREQFESHLKDFKNGRNEGLRDDRVEDIAKDLNLTAEQSAKISTLNSTFRTNLQSIRQNTALSNEEKKEQMKSLMKQHKTDMETLLTNDQKEQLKSRQKNRPNRTVVK
jgi:Spy/CpxP family protein refolding chaperone